MTAQLQNKKVAFISSDGFEQSELLEPKQKLEEMGAEIEILSINGNTEITGWNENNWDKKVKVDKQIDDANVADYDAVVIPGGQINPDLLRNNTKVVEFVKEAFEADNIAAIAAICHGPWVLIEANIVNGKQIASFPSIKTDVLNAGAYWNDMAAVVDGKLITSRNPDDIPMFVEKISEKLVSG